MGDMGDESDEEMFEDMEEVEASRAVVRPGYRKLMDEIAGKEEKPAKATYAVWKIFSI
jgi:hypothetical protein